jgi:hypothetical protein
MPRKNAASKRLDEFEERLCRIEDTFLRIRQIPWLSTKPPSQTSQAYSPCTRTMTYLGA